MKPWFYRQWFIVTLSIAVFAAMLTFVLLADSLERERAQQQLHILVLSEAGAVRARLEREINSTFYLTRGLIAYVSIHPHLTQHEFNEIAAEIVQEGSVFWVVDLGSTNGTYVNGHRVASVSLSPRDDVTVGPVHFGSRRRMRLAAETSPSLTTAR